MLVEQGEIQVSWRAEMTKNKVILGLLVVVMMAPSLAQADEALEKIVKARQAFMQIYSFNLGQLGAMAKGEADYDAKLANASAMKPFGGC